MQKLLLDPRSKENFQKDLEKCRESFLDRKGAFGGGEDDDLIHDYRFRVIGNTAIVPIQGYIFHKYSWMCWLFDGTACTELEIVVGKLASHPQIKRIIFDINYT